MILFWPPSLAPLKHNKCDIVLYSIFGPPGFKVNNNSMICGESYHVYSICTGQKSIKKFHRGSNYEFQGPQSLRFVQWLNLIMNFPLICKTEIDATRKQNELWCSKFQDFHISSISITTQKKKKIQEVLRCTSLELTWNASSIKRPDANESSNSKFDSAN